MKFKHTSIATFSFFLWVFSFTDAACQYWNLKRIDNDDGLSNSAVTAILKDSEGYLWFGTWDGLNRYDGSDIQVFKPDKIDPKSISGNVIRALFEDKDGNLWITADKEINRYNRDYENFETYFDQTERFSGREQILRSSISLDSTLWCGIYGVGLFYFSPSKNQFQKIEYDHSLDDYIKEIVGIAALTDERLMILTHNGELLEIEKGERWKISQKVNLSEKYKITPNSNWLLKDGQDRLLFISLSEGGVLIYNASTGKLKVLESGNKDLLVTTISKSLTPHSFWIGTDNGKILKLSTDRKYQLESLDHEFPDLIQNKIKIWSIYESSPNMLWVGTDGNGVLEYKMDGSVFKSVQKGNTEEGHLGHDIVRAIYENDKGEIWIGTRGNGLNILNPPLNNTRVINSEKGLSNNAVLSINRDHNKNYWIGTDGEGVDMIENTSGEIFHFPRDFGSDPDLNFRSVYAICVDSYGDIWLGTSGHGVIKLVIEKLESGDYNLKNHQQYLNIPEQPHSLNSNVVYSIIEDHPNALWIGSRGGGLQKLNTLTRKFENMDQRIDNDVISLMKDHQDALWVGTSNGLYQLDVSSGTHKISYFNQRDGLPNNTIHGILEDSMSNIWVSTNKGLSKWDRKKGLFLNYTKNDGLPSNEYSDGAAAISKISDQLYFGGINGLTLFNPKLIKESSHFPKLAILDLKLFNKSVHPGDETKLLKSNINHTDTLIFRHDQNFFSINFTVLDFHNKEKCQYAYFLENFDSEWNYVGDQNIASFTNVPPGQYRLQIKNTNEDGIWSSNVRQLWIHITPPLWKTWWAYFVYSLLIALFIVAVIYTFKKRAATRRKLYMERMERLKSEEISDYKLKFFTNITHEFRTPLSLILVPATKLFEERKHFPEHSHLMTNIYDNAKRLLKLIGELVEFRKAETGNISFNVQYGDLNKFVKRITTIFEQYAEQHEIEVSFSSQVQELNTWFDREIIEKIILNLISNAIKYTPPKGKLTVTTETHNDHILLKIADTGIGMSEDILGKIFDRFYSHQNEKPFFVEEMKSSGVGLALTKSLVEVHKGTIEVESTPGIGSTFTVKLPSQKDDYDGHLSDEILSPTAVGLDQKIEEELEQIKPLTSVKADRILSTKHKYTLLVIDDNYELKRLISDILGGHYNIIEASQGVEGLKLLSDNNIDLIISDVIMPEMNGFELCKIVKDDINTCHIPVILLTAMGDIEHRIKGIDIGADSYIPKPFHPRHLLTRISKLLEAKEHIRAAFREAPWKLDANIKGLESKDKKWVLDLTEFIHENMNEASLDSNLLAEKFAMSKTQLYRKTKALTGFTPHRVIKNSRLERASGFLKSTDKTVSEIIYETGFNNRTYFYSSFKDMFGCSPTDFRNKE